MSQNKKSNKKDFTLTKNGKSDYTIIISEKANTTEILAAKVFQDYIQRVSGAKIPIELDNTKATDNEVLIGRVNRDEFKDVPIAKLEKDGLYIKNTGKKLVIAGGTEKGTLYGVYTFLETYMGCRKYTSTVTVVPMQKSIVLNAIDDMQLPSFGYRDNFYPDAAKFNLPRDIVQKVPIGEYQTWHKLDNCFGAPDTGNEWGSFGHTFETLLSTKEYGQEHPEYFSYYDGKRHPESVNGRPVAQLCLSNPEVLEIVCKNLKKNIEANPGATYWCVTQSDNVNYCRCPECKATDEKYASFTPGSKMYGTHANSSYSPIGIGSVLTFVNKVADRFPDKIISTFAYQYTRVPPKNLVPRKNVNIILCSIESPRHIPVTEGDKSFCEDLEGWGKLTNNILLWDYVVQYRNLVSPFPNLHILQPNLKYFYDKGITMIFSQGNPHTGGEFHELKAYIVSKLLWDVNADVNQVMNEFLTGYYGNAGKIIREYIDLLEKSLAESGESLLIYGTPVEVKNGFLSEPLVTKYNEIFDRAEKAVAGSPEILERVKVARLPLYYAMLEIARNEKTGSRGAFNTVVGNKLVPKPEIVNILYDFVFLSIKTDILYLRERRIIPQQYLDAYTKFLKDPSSKWTIRI